MRIVVALVVVASCDGKERPAVAPPEPAAKHDDDDDGYRTVMKGDGYVVQRGPGPGRRVPKSKVVATFGQPEVIGTGELDKEAVLRDLELRRTSISACYEDELATKPKLAGTVKLRFTIRDNGMIANATASGLDPAVDACVGTILNGIVFPNPKGGGGVQVEVILAMRPK